MTHKYRKTMDKSDCAVSPVVGILLMLIVTIILASVISGYTSGIAKSQSKAPQMLIEASLINTSQGSIYDNESLEIRVITIDGSVNTKDLMIRTEWENSTGIHTKLVKPYENIYPIGFAPGSQTGSNFGNYSLVAGTRMNVSSKKEDNPNALKTVIDNWTSISDNTPVRIQFIHIPSGAIIVDNEIIAEM